MPLLSQATYFNSYNHLMAIMTKCITNILRYSMAVNQHLTGIAPSDYIAGGAMTLMCANVDFNVIKPLGRWHSDQMMHYLQAQACTTMAATPSYLPTLSQPHLTPNLSHRPKTKLAYHWRQRLQAGLQLVKLQFPPQAPPNT